LILNFHVEEDSKMKKIYLTKSSRTMEYYVDNGEFGERREYLNVGVDGLISYLLKTFNKKRKMYFFMDSSISGDLVGKVEDIFDGTNVKVSIEKKFS